MPLLQHVIDSADAIAAETVSALKQLRGDGGSPPHAIRPDGLSKLVRLLGEAAREREQGRDGVGRQLVRTAMDHGRERARDGFSDDLLFREYYLLRRALWQSLRQLNPGEAADTILRIDAEITMASAASLHGLHASGSRDCDEALVDRIASRWPAA